MAMQLLTLAILAVATQFLLGSVLFSLVACLLDRPRLRRGGRGRRWRVAWADAGRTSRRAAPYLAGLAIVAGALLWALDAGAPRSWSHGWWFLGLGAAPTAGGYVMWNAGRREARGRLSAARRQVRLGGELVFLGTFAQLVLLWSDLLFLPGIRRALLLDSGTTGVILLIGMICLVCAAFVAILAGLSGKPRPSAYFSTLLYLAGLTGVLASIQRALGS